MAVRKITTKYYQRRDTFNNWETRNPILEDGELGFETDTRRFKIGDGNTAWKDLKYIAEEATHLQDVNSSKNFQIWIGTQQEYSQILKKDANTIYIIK